MDTQQKNTPSFIIKDCAISTIATGISAGSLIDLREKLYVVPLESLYYHFWVATLRPYFVRPGYHNDFAVWVHRVLNEPALAERLSIVDPLHFASLEILRDFIAEIIDKTLDEKNVAFWVKKEDFFHFVRSKIIVMNTLRQMHRPEDLLSEIELLSTSSLFYHFIDSRAFRKREQDDFSMWIKEFGDEYQPLIDKISAIDIHFFSLIEIKRKLADIIHTFFRHKHELS